MKQKINHIDLRQRIVNSKMIAVYHQVSNFSAMKWIEHVTFIRDDDDVCPIIFQHTDLNYKRYFSKLESLGS